MLSRMIEIRHLSGRRFIPYNKNTIAMQRDLFKYRYFDEGSMPKWHCPTCSIGTLQSQEKLFSALSAETSRYIDEPWFEPDQIERVFNGVLRCTNCSETVLFVGNSGVDRAPSEDGGWEWRNYYIPRFFQPALNLIEMPTNKVVPVNLNAAVAASFSVFWVDLDSCANRLRTAIELLLDGMGVVRKVKLKATKELSLQQRIERIDSAQYPHLQNMLHAIKLVGNDGSHDLGQAERDEILDCYEILEHALQLIYPPPDKTLIIAQMAQQLIEKKPQGKKLPEG